MRYMYDAKIASALFRKDFRGRNAMRSHWHPAPSRPRGRGSRSSRHLPRLRPVLRGGFVEPVAVVQQQADGIGLRPPRRPFLHEPVQGSVKPGGLLRRQEPGHLPARVRPDASDRIGTDMAGGSGGAHDLAPHGERRVGCARCLAAHGVEPALDMGPDYLRLAAAGRRKQAQGRNPEGLPGLMPVQHHAEAAIFLRGQESLLALLPVAPAPLAGIAAADALWAGRAPACISG